jgi:hypothetical protein
MAWTTHESPLGPLILIGGERGTYGALARELGITDSGALVTGSRPVSGHRKSPGQSQRHQRRSSCRAIA